MIKKIKNGTKKTKPTGYKLNGKNLQPGQLPPPWEMGKVKPLFEQWAGWDENIYGYGAWEQLPKNAQKFLQNLQQRAGVPILLVGTGPGREDIVVKS